MPTTRSYHDVCPIARALDVVGERWALLVVRELLLGPQRFSDLRRALPAASSNMLTDRLRELEAHGVLRRRTLRPPAASVVYELTDRGRALEPVLDALGGWGIDEPAPANGSLTAVSVLLFLRGSVRARANAPADTHRARADAPADTYRVQLDERVWTIAGRNGQLEIDPDEPTAPDASIVTDPPTLNALLFDPAGLDSAIAAGAIIIEGDLAAFRRLLRAVA